MEPRSRHGLSRYMAAFLAMNVVFAAIGVLWRHPAGVVGWWVTWIVVDVAALSAIAMAAGFNRTLLEEWAYVRLYRSNAARVKALSGWMNFYNSSRPHTALGGRPPMARVNNAGGNYS
jgi:Integrase core domain